LALEGKREEAGERLCGAKFENYVQLGWIRDRCDIRGRNNAVEQRDGGILRYIFFQELIKLYNLLVSSIVDILRQDCRVVFEEFSDEFLLVFSAKNLCGVSLRGHVENDGVSITDQYASFSSFVNHHHYRHCARFLDTQVHGWMDGCEGLPVALFDRVGQGLGINHCADIIVQETTAIYPWYLAS